MQRPASDPRLRQRALPRVPAGAARAGAKAPISGPGARRCSSSREVRRRSACDAEYVDVYRELRAAGYTAVGEFHYLGLAEGHAAAAGCRRGGNRARPPPRRLCARRDRALPAGVGRRVPAASSRSCVPPGSGSASPPTPFEPARVTGSRSSGATPPSTSCRCTSTPTSSRARSRSASPSTGCVRSSCSTACGCLGPRTTVVHATHADGHELDLLAAAGARVCACPTTEANLGDGFLPVERRCTVASGSASARTRTSGSIRWRSCASSTGSPGVSPAGATSSPSTTCSRSARRRRGRAGARRVARRRRRRRPSSARGSRGLAERSRRELLGGRPRRLRISRTSLSVCVQSQRASCVVVARAFRYGSMLTTA